MDDCHKSVYEAVNEAAYAGRNLFKYAHGAIQESEALTWAITGKKPKNLKRRMERKMKYEDGYTSDLEDLLDSIDDKKLRDAVEASYRQSLVNKRITFVYKGAGTSESAHARLRVLTRLALKDTYLMRDK